MIKQSTAERALAAAMSTGADFAEIFLEDRDALSLSMLDEKMENVSTSREYGAGIRLLLGERSIYAYTNDTGDDALLKTALEAAAALGKTAGGLPGAIAFAASPYRNLSPIVRFPTDVPHREKIAVLSQASAAAKTVSSEISQIVAGYADVDQRILICNSEGLWAQDRRIRSRVVVQCVAASGTEFQTGYEAPGRSMGFEMMKGEIDAQEVARTAAQQAVVMLHAEECPAGVAPVVIDGGFGGVIFHEACGHALEATAVGKGNSVFCGKMGQAIAAPCVSAVDDGTMPNAWGTLNIDDEGRPTQRNVLIENGVLKGYLIDRLGARRMNADGGTYRETGSGRRQNYCFAPTSRMNNTYIAAGQDDEDDMIASLSEGLYAKSMGGGSVNPLTGEFNFSVREGYWIKNGDLKPVRGATLIGKGADVLMKIDRVGKVMSMSAGMCGSVSGQVPTNVGQPRIRVGALSIGGKGGAL